MRAKPAWQRLLLEEIGDGRVDRRAFARGLVLLACLLTVGAVVFLALFTFAEQLSAGGAVVGFALVAQLIGFTVAATLAVVLSVLGFAFANLTAKRMRDLGLPGWAALAIATMLGTAFSLGTPFIAAASYVAAVWAVLLFMPSPRRG